ncbi:MAG: hypothetical protein PHX44_03140 [Sulfurimonas sp.]|uniref:hypothetical protein n=1 Tax=Sulfurimonas sp. TaxID=2022749 RepID=UPI002623250C|nr:hypothetical protein [Sulfurimonas sp.]MDD2652028.1 hypothetical protein [Sulfurimonas sp.]MDD3452063.1 hypothetical protein [Sulfurimonas sp.]
MSKREACMELLKKEGISPDSKIDFDVNGEVHTLTFVFVIDSFMMASVASQESFVAAMQKALSSGDDGVQKFFEAMGQLLLMTHLSQKIEV